MATLGNFTVEEIAPPRLTYSRDGRTTGERVFRTSWDEARAVAAGILPVSSSTNGGIIIGAGAQFPGVPYLYIESIQVEPLADDFPSTEDAFGVATCPSGAKLTVSYSSLTSEEGSTSDDADGSVSLSLTTSIGGEFMTMGPRFTWASDGSDNQNEDAQCHLLVTTGEFTVTATRVPYLPLALWQSLSGKVNSTTMPYLADAAVGTVLFLGGNASKTVTLADGDSLWECQLQFSQRFVRDMEDDEEVLRGWQWLYRPEYGWDRPVLKNGEYLHQEADLNQLLFPQAEDE